jgi:hypothetical protein
MVTSEGIPVENYDLPVIAMVTVLCDALLSCYVPEAALASVTVFM